MSPGDWKQLYVAAESGMIELVLYYLHMGVDANYQHPEVMETALHVAVRHGHKEVVKVLLRFAADPSIKSLVENLDAWQLAERYQQQHIVELLNA